MQLIEIIVIVASSIFVLGVIYKSINDKKKGKTNCGCNCMFCDRDCDKRN